MNDFTKEELLEYILIRRNAIYSIIDQGIIPGIIDSIEITKMKAVLAEFHLMEQWFNE